jgi:hypothetical protein
MLRTTHLLVAAALLLAACTTVADRDQATSEEGLRAAAEAAMQSGVERTDDPDATLTRTEAVPGSTLTEAEHTPVWFERLDVDRYAPLSRIPRDQRDPPRDTSLGVLRVTDELERLAGECPVEIRHLVEFDLGPDGSPRIHEGLALLARSAMVEAAWIRDLASRPCSWEERPFIYQEVAELPCEIPDGRPYRCLRITTTATRAFANVQYAPIDVRSGKIVDLREITATVGARGYGANERIGEVLCALLPTSDRYADVFKDGACPQLPDGVGLHPTADGLRVIIPGLIWWYLADDVLLVPWEVLAWGDSVPRREAPTAASVEGPRPRPTPDAIALREAPEPWMSRLGVSTMIPMERIPDELADPPLAEGLGPRIVTSRVDRARRYCAAERRVITGVDLGPGAAAARMGADLVAVAADLHTNTEYLTQYGEDWCLPYGESRPWSFQELAEEACELPGGPDVRCFTLTQWSYFEGTTGNPFHDLHQPVYDTATGRTVPLATILAGAVGDSRTAVARTEAALCDSRALAQIGLASDCTVIRVRRAHPTSEGVWIGFNARDELAHLSTRYLEVFIPWSDLWG